MDFKYIITSILILLGSIQVYAQKLTDEQIVDKYLPAEILASVFEDTDPPLHVSREEVHQIFKAYNFGAKDGARYIAAIYSTADNHSLDKPLSIFSLIKVDKFGATSLLKPPSKKVLPNDLSEIDIFDLDNDGIGELLIFNYTERGRPYKTNILKWNGTNLDNITPSIKGADFFLEADALPLLVYETYNYKVKDTEDEPQVIKNILQLTANGFVNIGSFDFVKTVYKANHKPEIESFNEIKVIPGTYRLELKNISSDKRRPIRAEVIINGNRVLKPTDFCSRLSGKIIKPKDKKGKDIEEDDDDDKNEDGCKRCDPRKDIYADVTLNAVNSMKVKLYGKKESRIQITLKKKK